MAIREVNNSSDFPQENRIPLMTDCLPLPQAKKDSSKRHASFDRDAWTGVMSHLTARELGQLACSSHQLHAFSQQQMLWQKHAETFLNKRVQNPRAACYRKFQADSNFKLGRFEQHRISQKSSAYHLAWNPDGKYLAVATASGTVNLVDFSSHKESACMQHKGAATCIAWSAQGDYVASGGADGFLHILDFDSRKIALSAEHGAPITAIAWDEETNRVASGAQNGCVKFCHPAAGVTATIAQKESKIFSVAWSASRNVRIASSSCNRRGAPCAAYSPLGDRLATAELGYLTVFDSQTSEQQLEVPYSNKLIQLSWSPDGRHLGLALRQGEVIVLDATSGEVCMRVQRLGGLRCLAWSPDGSKIALGARDRVQIFDAVTGAQLARVVGCSGVESIAWRHDGSMLASGGRGNTLNIVDFSCLPSVAIQSGNDGQKFSACHFATSFLRRLMQTR